MQVSSCIHSSKEKNYHLRVCRRVILFRALPDLIGHKDTKVKIDRTFFPSDAAQLLKLPRASIAWLRQFCLWEKKDKNIGSC